VSSVKVGLHKKKSADTVSTYKKKKKKKPIGGIPNAADLTERFQKKKNPSTDDKAWSRTGLGHLVSSEKCGRSQLITIL